MLRNWSYEKLHEAITLLIKEEQALITALFFDEQTERDMAMALRIPQPAVHKRKDKILKKLKLFPES